MAIHIDRQDGETDMKRSWSHIGQKNNNNGPLHLNESDNSYRTSTSSNTPQKDGPTLRYFSRSEIARHNTEESAWIVAGDDIYDVTDYMDKHPAGKGPILKRTGGAVDCTQDLMFHSKRGRNMWKEQCLIGKVTNNEEWNGKIIEKPWWAFWECMNV